MSNALNFLIHEFRHHLRGDTAAAEASVMEEVLHGDVAREVAEERDDGRAYWETKEMTVFQPRYL